jgi:sugar phosphate isomerase/epimerase
MTPEPNRLVLGGITDEFSFDPEVAAHAMAQLGLTSAELRMVGRRNVVELSAREILDIKRLLGDHGLEITVIGSPLLKCEFPGTAGGQSKPGQDIFGRSYMLAEQKSLAERTFEVANEAGARIIRVFSFWRVADPTRVFDRVAKELWSLAELAQRSGVTLGLENEPACNVGTSTDVAKMVTAIGHPNLQVIWDPANSHAAGQRAFPEGYRSIPFSKLAHVHVKDCRIVDGLLTWCCLGEGDVDWKQIIGTLVTSGFGGRLHIETHWAGANGDKLEASRICARILRDLVHSVGVEVI